MAKTNSKVDNNNSKNIEKNTKVEVSVQNAPQDGITKIRENYGKNAIIIKDNLVFRTSTRVLERGPKSLLDLYLPNYGKMRKFVVRDNKVYEIVTDVIQTGTEFAQYTLADEVKMDISEITFDAESVWNKAKKLEKTAE